MAYTLLTTPTKRFGIALVACLATIFMHIGAHAQAIESPRNPQFKGPFTGSNLYPFMLPFIDPHPEKAQTAAAGTFSAAAFIGWASGCYVDLSKPKNRPPANVMVQLDYEVVSTFFRFRYSPLDTIEIFAELPFNVYSGGRFDNAIQEFHYFFKFPNGGRERVSQNQFHVRLGDPNELAWMEYSEPLSTVPWIQSGAKFLLVPRTDFGLTLSGTGMIKIPLSSEGTLFHPSNFDAALMANIDWDIEQWNFGINIGIAAIGPWGFIPVEYTRNVIMPFYFGAEWAVSNVVSLVLTFDGSTSPYKTGHDRLDNLSAVIEGGVKIRLSENFLLELAFQEEFITFTTTDITFFTALNFSIPVHASTQ